MEDNLHILMTTDTVGGVWTYSLSLCHALQEYDIKIHLAAMGGWASEIQKKEVQELPHVKLYESNYKLEWMDNPWEDVQKAHQWLHSLYLQIQPDLIHLNNFAKIHPDWNCPIITVYHSCVATWWQAVKSSPLPEHWHTYLQQLRETTAASDVVVAPSRAMLQQAVKIHRISSPTKVIYNAREVKYSSAIKKEKFIFCIGRIWDEAKNLQLVASIAKDLPWPVFIAGNHKNPNGAAIQLKNVKCLGQLSNREVQEWMQRAAIFISPTKYEPFGLAILEAAKAKCALVISKLDSLREIFGENATYIHPDDKTELLSQLLHLIKNDKKRIRLAQSAWQQAQQYTLAREGKAYGQLYQHLLHQYKKQKMKSL